MVAEIPEDPSTSLKLMLHTLGTGGAAIRGSFVESNCFMAALAGFAAGAGWEVGVGLARVFGAGTAMAAAAAAAAAALCGSQVMVVAAAAAA
jgi:hypothetical protein